MNRRTQARCKEGRRRLTAALAVFCFLSAGIARAQVAPGAPELGQRPASMFSVDYLQLLAQDAGQVLAAPAHWDAADWGEAGLLGAAVAGTAVFDNRIRDWAQNHRNAGRDRFAKDWQLLGAQGSFAVLAGFEAWGVVKDDANARAVAMDGLAASVIAAGIIAPVLKYSAGRVRPSGTSRAYLFRPFSGNQSFPSGHATQAFAVAAVIAAHTDAWWQRALVYSAAGLVGAARIEQNAHYASDVAAGAILGTLVGRAVVRFNDRPPVARLGFAPYVAPDGGGLVWTRDF